jgi:hypothetical protein
MAGGHAPDPFGGAFAGDLHQGIDAAAGVDQGLFGGAHLRHRQDLIGGLRHRLS